MATNFTSDRSIFLPCRFSTVQFSHPYTMVQQNKCFLLCLLISTFQNLYLPFTGLCIKYQITNVFPIIPAIYIITFETTKINKIINLQALVTLLNLLHLFIHFWVICPCLLSKRKGVLSPMAKWPRSIDITKRRSCAFTRQ